MAKLHRWFELRDASENRAGKLSSRYIQKHNASFVFLTLFNDFNDLSTEAREALQKLAFKDTNRKSAHGFPILMTSAFSVKPQSEARNEKLNISADQITLLNQAFPNLRMKEMTAEQIADVNLYGDQQLANTVSEKIEESNTTQTASSPTDGLLHVGNDTVHNNGDIYLKESENDSEQGFLVKEGDNRLYRVNTYSFRSNPIDFYQMMFDNYLENLSFSKSDLDRFRDIAKRVDIPSDPDTMQFVVSGLITEAYIRADKPGQSGLDDLHELYRRFPTTDDFKLQPPTTLIAAKNVFGDELGKKAFTFVEGTQPTQSSVVYPMGFNEGSVVTTNPQSALYFKENDDIGASVQKPDDVTLDGDSILHGVVIASNSPIETPYKDKVTGFPVTDESHLLTTKAVQALNEDSRLAIVVPSDSSKANTALLNHLSAYTNVISAARYNDPQTGDDMLLAVTTGHYDVPDKTFSFDGEIEPLTSPRAVADYFQRSSVTIANQLEQEAEVENLQHTTHRERLSAAANKIAQKGKVTIVNDRQVLYTPLSRPTNSDYQICVPASLARATNIAGARLQSHIEENGYNSVIHYLADKMGVDEELLYKDEVAMPHQIDAVAQAIRLHETEGRSPIIGANTGTGKTRMQAMLAKYLINQDIPIFYQVAQTANMQSFLDELSLFASKDEVRPICMNHEHPLKWSDGSLFGKWHNDTLTAWGDADHVLDENLILATVNVTNRSWTRKADESKAEFFNRMNSGKMQLIKNTFKHRRPAMMLDESHKSAGDSNSRDAALFFGQYSQNQFFFSATSLPSPAAMLLYSNALPRGLNADSLETQMKMGKEPVIESIITALAEEGAYMRVELPDFRSFKRIMADDHQIKINHQVSEVMAGFYDRYTTLSTEINQSIERLATAEYYALPEDKRPENVSELGFSSSHFGSKAHHIISNVTLLQASLDAADRIENHIKEGRRAVYFAEHTGGSIFNRVVEERLEGDRVQVPTLRDLAREVVESARWQHRREGRNFVKYDITTRMNATEKATFDANEKACFDYINNEIPLIPFSPFDLIQEELRRRGYNTAEISGRKYRLEDINIKDMSAKYRHLPTPDHGAIIEQYHNPDIENGQKPIDALIVTRSGATGYNLHAKIGARDDRPVSLICGEIPRDGVDIMQLSGRVDRLDQSSSPILEISDPGVPAVSRMIQNTLGKISFLSSASTGNAKNELFAEAAGGTVALGSQPGQLAIAEYLQYNPDLARRLDLADAVTTKVNKKDGTISYNSQVNISHQFMSRLLMLSPNEANDVFTDVLRLAELKEAYLKNAGTLQTGGVQLNDLRASTRDKIILRECANPDNSGHALLGEVVGQVIEFKREHVPANGDEVLDMVESARESNARHPILKEGLPTIVEEMQAGFRDSLKSYLDVDMKSRISKAEDPEKEFDSLLHGIINNDEYKHSSAAWSIRAVASFQDWVKRNLANMEVGGVIDLSQFGSNKSHVIVGAQPPRAEQLSNISVWQFQLISPGDAMPTTMSLRDIAESTDKEQSVQIEEFSDMHLLFDDFNAAKTSSQTDTLNIVTGNLLEGARLLQGNSAIQPFAYTDKSGSIRRGFKLPKNKTFSDLLNVPAKFSGPVQAAKYLRENQSHQLFDTMNQEGPNKYKMLSLRATGTGEWELTIPGNQANAKSYMEHTVAVPAGDGTQRQVNAFEYAAKRVWQSRRGAHYMTVTDENLDAVLQSVDDYLAINAAYSADAGYHAGFYGGKGSAAWLNKEAKQQQRDQLELSAEEAISARQSMSA
ncbi:strawberry notch C-terminal domain-containing protein [Idiomarina abyssalis]|uniref:Strawberry notch C-terminal domain-containing protein n=1 Tax=Idiomarina abyssalis TaxID=86102 RepID=A0A8I1KHF8_9GAMM|nr:strawberry notch C-terminal domain-containing protein [Idiomarina abyssalis]MBJ7265568.1 strawberry notch C-terminal domain-containing protein [Idiomarina abyssalis]MBJ7316758.1 strawberry notch C-terminal domain-containing protein [Idiomarina abyssalis]